MRKLSKVVSPTERFQVVASDPDDDRTIEAAVAGQCQAIVTDDQHLLRLRNFRGIKTVTARGLLQQEPAK
jgi:predicted nucleic acid-binding protein